MEVRAGQGGRLSLGTYHSPVPDMESLRPRIDGLLSDREIPGIDFRDIQQLELARALGEPWPSTPPSGTRRRTPRHVGHRYYYDNGFYFWGDGVVLHSMLRHIRPTPGH